MEYPNFWLADVGAAFSVLVFDEYVIKVPRKNKYFTQLKDLAKLQNILAEKVDGILPCEIHSNCLVMPTAPGVRVDKLDDKTKRRAKQLADEMGKEIIKAGYKPKDMGENNTFYDEKEDKLYFVDLHLVRRI